MNRPAANLVSVIAAAWAVSACAGSPKRDAGTADKANDVGLRRDMAASLIAHREWAAAVQPLLDLSAQHPDDPEILTLLGTVYREQGLFEQAETAYSKAIRVAPTYAPAYAGRGISREIRGYSSDATLKDFETAVRLAPGDAAYANNLGFALSVRGRYAEAAAALQDALMHDPLSRRMRNNLGFVYAGMGQFERAKREFEHGGTQDEVENNLGFAYERAGDLRQACAHYREALSENPLLQTASENARRACPAGSGMTSVSSQGRTTP